MNMSENHSHEERKSSYTIEDSNNTYISRLGIKKETATEEGNFDYIGLGTIKTEDVKDEMILNNTITHKVGCDSGDCEPLTLKLENPLNQVGIRNDSASPGFDNCTDISIKQECANVLIVKMETEDDTFGENEAVLEEENNSAEKFEVKDDASKPTGCDTGDHEPVTIKLEDPWNQVSHYDGHTNDSVGPGSDISTDISIKHESLDVVIEKTEIEVDTFAEIEEDLKQAEDINDVSKPYLCQVCNYRTTQKGSLTRHSTVKHKIKPELYCCEFCDFKTKRKDGLRRHTAVKHDNRTEYYNCQFCDYRTKRKENLKRHNIVRHDEEAEYYKCQVCDYRTKNKGYLGQHFRVEHDEKAKWHQCHVCEYSTKKKSNLRQHFRNKHDENDDKAEWHYCHVCDHRTKKKCNLRQHFRVKHDEKAEWHQCQLCNYSSKRRDQLRRHFRNMHDDKTEWYQCIDCDYRTSRKDQLKQHFQRKHHVKT